MTIEQMNYFVTIVEYKTYQEASVILNISQSSLSKSIQRLENELNVQLFDRTKRTVSLTKEGTLVYSDFKAILASYHRMLNHLNEVSIDAQNILKIGYLPIASLYGMSSKILEFTKKNPSVKVIKKEVELTPILDELDIGSSDLAILHDINIDKKKYNTYKIDEDELVLFVSNDNPISKRKSISLSELEKENIMSVPTYSAIYKFCQNLWRKCGIEPRVVGYARSDSILDSVRTGEAVSLLMKRTSSIFNMDNISMVPLDNPEKCDLVIALLKSRKTNDATKKFIKFMQKQ